MRVSVVTREYPPAIYGGAGVHVAQLVPRLAKLVDVDVQCMGEPRAGATAHAEDYPPEANPALQVFGADLGIVSAMPQVDVVHSHTWYANLAGHLAGLYQGIPHVVTGHSLEPLRPWKKAQLGGGYALSSWAERTAYAGASAVIAVSQAMAGDIASCYGDVVDPSIIQVVHNGIDTDEFYCDSQTDFAEQIGLDVNRPSVVFVGRITRQKGLVHLLRAARHLDFGTQVVLLASSPDTPEIAAEFQNGYQELVDERGNDVIWVEKMAPRAGLRQVLSHATVFACPSIYEPLGIVNLEAMACQTAVVASGVGGIPEVVDDGVTGTLVAYDPNQGEDQAYQADFEARFGQALNVLLENPDRAQVMGQAGRLRCQEMFSWDAIAAQTVAVYQDAIAAHQSTH